MTTVELIRRINLKLNYANFEYDDLTIQLDEAIDYLNDYFKINLQMITDWPLMDEDHDVSHGMITRATKIDWIADEVLRRFIIPFVAGSKLTTLGRDGTPELAQATAELAKLAMKYRPELGAVKLLTPIFEGAYENQDVQFSGSDNYGTGNQDPNTMALTDPFKR